MSATLHPSFGPVPPAEFMRACQAPAGEATNILRKYVPSFGVGSNIPSGPRKFEVTVYRAKSIEQTATVVIEAASEEEVKELVWNMEDWEFAWHDKDSCCDPVSVRAVKEAV